MKKITQYLFAFTIILLFSGCDVGDKIKSEADRIEEKINAEIERVIEKYDNYVDPNERGERPFELVYQEDESNKNAIMTSACASNQIPKHVYFMTQQDAHANIFTATKNLISYPAQGVLKPYWDIRYINPVSQYINGQDGSNFPNHSELTGLDARSGINNTTVGTELSQVDASANVMQSECVNGSIAGGTTLNLFDSPEQVLTYAGIQSTFAYNIHTNNHIKPWQTDGSGNIFVQASFDTPIYNNFSSNIGGSVSFNIFLYNPKTKQHLNYVIGVYAMGEAWQQEKSGIRFDPTTNIIHVATVIHENSWWSTISPKSNTIREVFNQSDNKTSDDGQWNNFYRVNISYQNLLAVLKELNANPPEEVAGQSFGINPEEWEIIFLAIQYELEEQGGKALLSGSFNGFSAYTSELPL